MESTWTYQTDPWRQNYEDQNYEPVDYSAFQTCREWSQNYEDQNSQNYDDQNYDPMNHDAFQTSCEWSQNYEDQNYEPMNRCAFPSSCESQVTQITARINGELNALQRENGELNALQRKNKVNIPKVFALEENDFEPRIISFGPYHRGNKRLSSMEDRKILFVDAILKRKRKSNLKCYVAELYKLKDQVKESYTEHFGCIEDDKFVEMMLLDGCFITEFFISFRDGPPPQPLTVEAPPGATLLKLDVWFNGFGDEFLKSKYARRVIGHDMLLLQNQLPFVVIKSIFDLAMDPRDSPCCLSNYILHFFNHSSFLQNKPCVGSIPNPETVKHLLDFYHRFLILAPETQDPQEDPWKIYDDDKDDDVLRIPSAKVLASAGVKFKERKGSNLLGVTFVEGNMKIPSLVIDGFTKSLIQNLVAFEKFDHPFVPTFTAYVKFLDHIINTAEDVALLHKKKIINHALGSNKEVADLLNSICGSTFNPQPVYMKRIYKDVKEYRELKWNEWRETLMMDYFDTPWSNVNAAAAAFGLGLTFISTAFTIQPRRLIPLLLLPLFAISVLFSLFVSWFKN